VAPGGDAIHRISGVPERQRVAVAGRVYAHADGRARMPKVRKQDEIAAADKLARIRLLSEELDNTRQASVERTRSIDSKSSFAIVVAGVVAGAAFTGLVDPRTCYIGLVPFALTIGSVIAAVVALWPTRIWVTSARDFVNTYVNDPMSGDVLEDHILEVKAKEITHRDEYNEKRSTATKVSLVLLIVSLIAALIVVGINAALPEGVPNGPGTGTSTSTGTP
jgi:hypothetical protein